MTRRARLCDFEKRITSAQPLPKSQRTECNSTCGDVFPRTPGRNSEFIQNFLFHQQHLPRAAASPMDAVLEALVLDRLDFLGLAHWLAVRRALKQMRDLSHAAPPLRRSFASLPWRRCRSGTVRLQNEFWSSLRRPSELRAATNRP